MELMSIYDAPRRVLVVLRSEIPSDIYAKLRTVAASNNRVHMPWSLYYCSFAPRICMVLFFMHIPSVVNHTINATPPERQQWSQNVASAESSLRNAILVELSSVQLYAIAVESTWNLRKIAATDEAQKSDSATFVIVCFWYGFELVCYQLHGNEYTH